MAARASVIFGYVRQRGGAPIEGARVEILDHAELGHTLTDASGRYDIVVNGGGPLTIDITHPGYIRSQRTVSTAWGDFYPVDDIMLVAYDIAHAVSLPTHGTMPVQVVRGSAVEEVIDEETFTRRATLMFLPGTTALEVGDSGSTPLTSLQVRATEFTVGLEGPSAMPATLPSASAYTYAVELSVDEAMDARTVEFSQPVIFYVEHRLQPDPHPEPGESDWDALDMVGQLVPAGWYDREAAEWMASENGRIIRVLSSAGGVAEVDIDGDGVAESAAALDGFGIDIAERQALAATYPDPTGPGPHPLRVLWRVPMQHFTPWDLNMPYGPPSDVVRPTVAAIPPEQTSSCEYAGSIIRCESQGLGEEIPVAGTDLMLRYSSERVPGRRDEGYRRIILPLEPGGSETVVAINVAGRRFLRMWPTEALPEEYVFDWDGLDGFGREVPGIIEAHVVICRGYPVLYGRPENQSVFGVYTFSPGGGGGSGGGAVSMFPPPMMYYCADADLPIGTPRNQVDALFGWELDQVHHRLPSGAVLRGDGLLLRQADDERLGRVDTVIDGAGLVVSSGQSVGAYNSTLVVEAAVVEPDGGIVIGHLRPGYAPGLTRIGPAGDVSTVAGGFSVYDIRAAIAATPDGTPAAGAAMGSVQDLALGHRGDIYTAEIFGGTAMDQGVIRRIDAEGRIHRIAGSGSSSIDEGEGGRGPNVYLRRVISLAVANDGSVYFVEGGWSPPWTTRPHLRHVTAEGHVRTILAPSASASTPSVCAAGWEAGDAISAVPISVAVGLDGSVYVAVFEPGLSVGCILQMGNDGTFARVTGLDGEASSSRSSGEPALAYRAGPIYAMAATPDGLYFRESRSVRVVRSGLVFPVVSDPDPSQSSPRTVPQPTLFEGQMGVMPGLRIADSIVNERRELVAAPDGSLIVQTFSTGTHGDRAGLHRITDYARQGTITDGGEVHEFDPEGRHVRTISALTGTLHRDIVRGGDGLIQRIVDGAGNEVLVQRAPGLVRLVPELGPATEIHDTDADGWADYVEYVGTGRRWTLEHQANGLLDTIQRPDGATHTFNYDDLGRLIRDTQPGARHASLVQLPTVYSDEGTQRGVEYITTMGLTTRHETFARLDGSTERTITRPDGVTVQQVSGATFEASVDSGTPTREATTTYPEHYVRGRTRLTPDSAGWADAVPELVTIRLGSPEAPGAEQLSVERARARIYAGPTLTQEVLTTTLRGGSEERESITTFQLATRTLTSRSPLGRERSVVLDDRDRVVEMRAPGLHPMRVVYDARGRVSRTATIVGGVERRVTTYGYTDTSVGELWSPATVDDALGETTTIDWTSHFQVGSATRAGRTVITGYESAVSDRITSITPPTRPAHGFSFEPSDDLRTYDPPLVDGASAQVRWTYDADGRVEEVSHAGRVVDLVWDTRGRLDEVVAESYSVDYDYDAVTGELLSTTTEDGQRAEIAADGPLLRSVTWSGGVEGSVGFGYDALWQRDRVTVETSGTMPASMAARYAFDDDGAPACITINGEAPSATCATGLRVVVDPVGDGSTLPGVTTEYRVGGTPRVSTELRWDGFGEPTEWGASWTGSSESGALGFSYTSRDDAGRILAMTETEVGALGTVEREYAYTYDVHGRLTHVRRGGVVVEEYAYDLNGNRTYAQVEGLPTLTASDIEHDERDRLVRYGDTRFEYDAQGRLERRRRTPVGGPVETTEYTYDLFGGLRRVALPDGRVITYRNDGMGRRIERAVGGTVTHRWLYLDGLRPVAELDGDNNLRSVFVYGTGRAPDLMIRDGVSYRIVTNELGTVRRVIALGSGEIVQELDYDSHGRVIRDTTPGFQPFGYVGGHHDSLSGLTRFGRRDYDPHTGRWESADPAGFDGGQANLYVYCEGDPVNWIDPFGLNRIRLAFRLARGAMATSRALSRSEALSILRRGGDVWVATKREAIELARAYSGRARGPGRARLHGPHRPGHAPHSHGMAGGDQLPGHIFYGAQGMRSVWGGALDFRSDGCLDSFDVLEFANPLGLFGISGDDLMNMAFGPPSDTLA